MATRLRDKNKQLVNIHCIAHRLALAAAQSAEGIPYLLKFKSILGQLFRFYDYSSVRTSGLKAIQVKKKSGHSALCKILLSKITNKNYFLFIDSWPRLWLSFSIHFPSYLKDIVQSPHLKLKEAKDVRWLSHNAAVDALRRTLPAVIMSLEREAAERHEAVAQGLATFTKSYNFVATLLMLADVLPLLARLSQIFQVHIVLFQMHNL